jgi:hypothetical protein
MSKITLDKFYEEFINFTKEQDRRWKENNKQWTENKNELLNINSEISNVKDAVVKTNKKFDKLINFLDEDIMESKRKIEKLEEKVFVQN